MSASASGIVVDGVKVRIVRKQVKTLRIRVAAADGHVEASVPAGMPAAHVEDFVRAKMPWIAAQQERLAASPQGVAARASKEEVAAWRTIVEALVPDLVAKWEPVLGVRAGKITYRNMTSRWGSCQPKTGRICINVRLALYPPECLEYVVVHELAHLREPNHGPRFHALLDAALPNWRTAERKLRA